FQFYRHTYHSHIYLHTFPTRRSSDLILPSKYKKVYTVDFKSFEPSVVAYMTQDSKVIDFLNQKDGLYDALLSELDLPDEQRIFRSEEHTSELQSRFDLVCRLLLE